MNDQVEQLLGGNRRALARLLTAVENQVVGLGEILSDIFPHTGRAWVIGVTGAPGTGKSTLVTALAKAYRALGKTVAIIAVDPTSPFSGGAILGDRIRMRDLSGDSGVFIRSMATRGNLGGLSRATRDAIRVMDAAGFDIIIVETVGAGQSEVDIALAAKTTLVVDAPGLGDDVQAIKAGILEIADILVVNKADRPGAKNTVRSLKTMLELGHPGSRSQVVAHHGQLLQVESKGEVEHHEEMWIPPIVETAASEGKGIDELIESINRHIHFLANDEALVKLESQQIEIELYDRLRDALMAQLLQKIPGNVFADVIGRIQAREIDPESAVEAVLAKVP